MKRHYHPRILTSEFPPDPPRVHNSNHLYLAPGAPNYFLLAIIFNPRRYLPLLRLAILTPNENFRLSRCELCSPSRKKIPKFHQIRPRCIPVIERDFACFTRDQRERGYFPVFHLVEQGVCIYAWSATRKADTGTAVSAEVAPAELNGSSRFTGVSFHWSFWQKMCYVFVFRSLKFGVA